MKTFRTVLFWTHLAAGTVAGVVILIMSVTGVALTYEKQMVEWSDRNAWTAPSPADATPLSPETLLAKVAEAQPGTAPLSLTLRSDRSAPATVTVDGNKSLLVDPYTGAIIGEPPAALRGFFRTMTSWHRYLAMDGASRATGRMLTGSSNLLFLFIVLSGMYLWLPKLWTWIQFRNVLWFRTGLSWKARDFNWHNVIGIWSAIPLAIVVAGALPISYTWAGNLVYRVVGENPPAPPGGGPGGGGPPQARGGAEGRGGEGRGSRPGGPEGGRPDGAPREGRRPEGGRPEGGRGQGERRAPQAPVIAGLDASWSVAQQQIPAWRTITSRFATSPAAPIVVAVDEGYGGQPQKRTTLTIDRATTAVSKSETFADLTPGRRLRSWLRFAHTGEIYGITGQTIAGLASLGGAFLVYTGIALMLRRFAAWIGRLRNRKQRQEQVRAA